MGRLRVLLLLCAMCASCAGAKERDGSFLQQSSVSYPRASIFEGLPQALVGRVDEVLDNRLSSSAFRSISAALSHWDRVRAAWGWQRVILSDDPERGGKMAAFVIGLLDDTNLVADSISNSVWALRQWMMLQRQADPLMGVMQWREFFLSVRVIAHVPHEPRRMVPLDIVRAIVARCDLNSFWQVQFIFLMLVCLFTFSRSECPCPKTFTGENAFDKAKHWTVRDIVVRLVDGVYVLAVRFKSIKQDPRIERPTARGVDAPAGEAAHGGSDWSYVGDIPGDPMSIFVWYRRLMAFYRCARPLDAPFFMARDRVRPYTYPAMMSDFRTFLSWVSPTDTNFGIHGLRVLGYNLCKSALDDEIATAHGGWQPGSAGRYERFSLRRVFGIAAAMVGSADPYAMAPPAGERPVRRTGVRRGGVDVPPAAPATDPAVLVSAVVLQAVARRFLVQRRGRVQAAAVEAEAAAVAVQAAARRYLARRSRIEAVTRIQSVARGVWVRRAVAALLMAVTFIQSVARGVLARRAVIALQAAVLIQSFVRGGLARRSFVRVLHSMERGRASTRRRRRAPTRLIGQL